MARKNLPVTPVSHLQLTPDATAVPVDIVNGMWMNNDGSTYISLKSTSGSPQTVTITLPSGVDVNLPAGPRTYPVGANLSARTGFFPVSVYGTMLLFTASSALISVTAYSFA